MVAERGDLVIYGSSGFAREVAWLVEECGIQGDPRRVVAFIDDEPAQQGKEINEIPVMSIEEAADRHASAQAVVAVGSPPLRRKLVERAASAGFRFATIVHPNVARSRWVDIEEGTVICAGNILTTNIRIGKQVQINLDCTVGHDVVMGDYATLAPGVHVSGWVRFEEETYCGTGATIINGTQQSPLIIGRGGVVGAGACVTKSVEPGTTVVGVPARALARKDPV